MKKNKLFILSFLLMASAILLSAGKKDKRPEWDNMNILEVNRQKPHATMMVYQDEVSALSYQKENSPYYKLINGQWKYTNKNSKYR